MNLTEITAQTPSMNLCFHQILRARAETAPDTIAITAPSRTPLSYGRLWSQVNEVIEALNSFGLGRNDRVAIVLPNGPDMATAFCAISAGATSAPLNPSYRFNEFDFYLTDLGAKALVVEAGSDSVAREVARARGIPIIELSAKTEAGVFTLHGSTHSRALANGFAKPEDKAMVLHTSGTTSKPKRVALTQINLCASALNVRQVLQLTPDDKCLSVMPLFHIHGLSGAILASLTAGARVVCTPGFYAPKFFDWMDEYCPTWYSAVPTIHQAILARAPNNQEIIDRCRLRFIRSSSAALPPQVMLELERTFGAPVLEAYGMTEAIPPIASNPVPPGERKIGSVGIAAGPEVAVMNEAGKNLAQGEKGEIVIRGAHVVFSYENNPEANQSAFTNGWFRTGDQGWLDQDGYLYITGRIKELINRGGEKISPREVDEVLMDHPAVMQVVSFAMPHSTLGEDVAAAIVLAEKAYATENEIREFAATRLADYKVPRRILFVDEIPKGPTGKIQRIGLAERLGLTVVDRAKNSEIKSSFVSPRTPLENRVARIWSQVLDVERVGVHDDFIQLGGDSVLAAQIVARIYSATGVEISLVKFFSSPTVAWMCTCVIELLTLKYGSDLTMSLVQEE